MNITKKILKVNSRPLTQIMAVVLCLTMCLTALSIHATAASTTNLNYTFSYTTPGLSSQHLGSYDFTKVSEPNAILLGTSGEPALPVSFVKIALPPLTTVDSITITGQAVDVQTDINLLNQPVKPYQNSVPFGDPAPSEIAYNQELYQTASTYPETPYNGDYQVGYCRGYAILSLGLQPVQYLPSEGKLRYYPQLTVSVNLKSAPMNQFYRNSAEDAAWVQALVCNPDVVSSYRTQSRATTEYPGGLCDPSQHFDYVIVTSTQNGMDHWDTSGDIPYNWDSLIAQENSQGLSATIVTKEDINACADYSNSTPSSMICKPTSANSAKTPTRTGAPNTSSSSAVQASSPLGSWTPVANTELTRISTGATWTKTSMPTTTTPGARKATAASTFTLSSGSDDSLLIAHWTYPPG